MSPEQRITKIEDFVHLQRYLFGRMFHVIHNEDDEFIIELEAATERQLKTLRHRLRINEMYHIAVKAITVLPPEQSKVKKHGKKN